MITSASTRVKSIEANVLHARKGMIPTRESMHDAPALQHANTRGLKLGEMMQYLVVERIHRYLWA
jgi:hypothetical protein